MARGLNQSLFQRRKPAYTFAICIYKIALKSVDGRKYVAGKMVFYRILDKRTGPHFYEALFYTTP